MLMMRRSQISKKYDLVAQMNSKLDKLDSIERHLAEAHVDQHIKDLEQSFTFVNKTANKIKQSQKLQNESVTSLKEMVAMFEAQNAKLYQEIIDTCALFNEKQTGFVQYA